ncbi:ester cyclase [Nocardia sp. NBC_01503]|uniref:ester cyclase n=1 Tax=Nocardia sp. NBC_01503 TaxID=2975997 RepID=UPI002E7BF9EA|nr:ester cyclase [Nocardia sp. NBC_01503]WTL30605.1 ester cyclase [Nocardia sp. NBC_01503]
MLGAVLFVCAATVLGACSTQAKPSADPVDRSGRLLIPQAVHIDGGLGAEQAERQVRVAQLLYTFWNTGDTGYLDRAIAPTFRDNTLPPGRPQGPTGPATASKSFRTAVPDLTCELSDLYLTGDTLTARLVFRGHFTGTYNGTQGTGQPVEFNAIDLQHLGGDHTVITEDWHIEDNLTFLHQIGQAS